MGNMRPLIFHSLHPTILSLGGGEWTDWGDCDDEGLQHRTRHCGEDQKAEANLCQGNITQSRPCQPHEVPGKQNDCKRDCCILSTFLQAAADRGRQNPVLHKCKLAQ